MKRYTTLLVGMVLSILSPLALAAGGWQTDLDAAMKQAKAENKSVLVEFTGSDWCPPCKFMNKKVFSKKEFIDKASQKFILVELDFPRSNPALSRKNEPYAAKYGIEGFPSVVLLDSNGKVSDKFVATNYPSVEKFLSHLSSQ